MALITDSLTIPPAGSLNSTGKGAAARQLPAAASRAVVPLVYGEDRFSGLILNVLAAAGTPGTLLVQVLWCHGCDSINDPQLNDQALPAGATITHYTGAQTVADATLVAAFAAQGISGVLPLTGYAWSLLAMPAALFDGQLNITARVRGRRCYDPAFDTTAGGAGPQRLADPATWAYTDIPAVCLGDFVASSVYGCGQPVNWDSVRTTAGANRAIVPGSSEQRRLVGVSFSSAAPATDVAETLRAYAGCFLLPGATGVRLLADANDAPSASYSHAAGEIASISALDLRDLGQAPTAVEIIYTDTTAIPWRDASAIAQLDGAGTTRPWRLSQVRMPGIHRYSQAMREAVERLNKLALNDLSTSLEVFDSGIKHDIGDVITVTHPLGLAAETLRVNGVSMPGPGRWQLELVKHAPAAYSDSVATVAPTVDGSRLLPIAPPADVAGLAGVVSKGIITWRWTAATERFYSETRLRLNGTDWASATPLWAGRGNSLVQQVGAVGTYLLRARHAVIDGQESEGITTATVTVEADDLDASAPDLTPPPQPDNPTLTGGFATVMLEQDAPAYIQGHGHGTTRLYGKVYPGTGDLPVFADAAVLVEFPGTAYAYSAGVGVTLRLWITWVTRDGVESETPAGGTNGFAVTTSKVGSSDLGPLVVLSSNLAANSVTADKALLDIGGSNLVGNNSFEVDLNADGAADGWGLYDSTGGGATYLVAGRISGYAQRFTTSVGVDTYARGIYGGPGLAWRANTTYVVSFYARAPAGSGFLGKATSLNWNTSPSTVTLKNPGLSSSWQRYAFRITWGGSVEGSGPLYLSVPGQGSPTGAWDIDDIQVEEGDTLSGYQGKLALNTIVAGDGAIANLAITNALIGNLAVDDAKMANVSVAKLLADALSVGQYIRSTGYSAGSSGWIINADGTAEFGAASIRGQLVASQIDARGLSIKDGSGNVILAAGSPLAAANITPAAEWLNSNVSVGGRNLLVGASSGAGWIHDYHIGTEFRVTASSTGETRHIFSGYIEIPGNTEVTLTFESKQDGPVSGQPDWFLLPDNYAAWGLSSLPYPATTYWSKNSFTFVTPSGWGLGADVRLRIDHNGSPDGSDRTYFARNIKLEYGNKATTWTPPVEDVKAASDAAATTANWTGVGDRPPDSALINSYVAMGANMIPNSSCTVTSCWFTSPVYTETVLPAVHTNKLASAIWASGYVLKGIINNVTWNQTGSLSGGADRAAVDVYPLGGAWETRYSLPATAGEYYMWSVYAHMHRCGVGVGIYFYNGNGDTTGYVDPPPRQTIGSGDCEYLSQYIRPFVKMQAPPGTSYMRVYVRKFNTDSGGDSWIWLAAPQLEVVGADATGPSEYTPGPATSIGQLGYSGDLDATKGAQLGVNLKDSGGTVLSDAAVKNSGISISISDAGAVSVSGGPSASGAVTAVGIGAVKTDASNAPSSILNSSISFTVNSNGTLSITGGPTVSGAVTLTGIGAGALAAINQITAANASTYIGAAAIDLANIKVASITTLGALSSYLGTVEIASGGYLRSGQTGWSTGSGFWLGWDGEPAFSLGTETDYIRYKPSTGWQEKRSNLVLGLSGGTMTLSTGATGSIGFAGSRTVSVTSGGSGSYAYAWSIVLTSIDSSGAILITSSPSAATVSLAGYLPYDGSAATAEVYCTVRDTNTGKTSSASFTAVATNTA